jgi:hypothetical protein
VWTTTPRPSLIAQAGIDVLVDLQGLTNGARPAILGYRAAPVQVSYLGLPGTSGLPGVDWILCRPLCAAARAAALLHRAAAATCRTATRSATGSAKWRRARSAALRPARRRLRLLLVQQQPQVHARGVRRLDAHPAAVPGSVLWLLADNDTARENMLRQPMPMAWRVTG